MTLGFLLIVFVIEVFGAALFAYLNARYELIDFGYDDGGRVMSHIFWFLVLPGLFVYCLIMKARERGEARRPAKVKK